MQTSNKSNPALYSSNSRFALPRAAEQGQISQRRLECRVPNAARPCTKFLPDFESFTKQDRRNRGFHSFWVSYLRKRLNILVHLNRTPCAAVTLESADFSGRVVWTMLRKIQASRRVSREKIPRRKPKSPCRAPRKRHRDAWILGQFSRGCMQTTNHSAIFPGSEGTRPKA